MMPPLRDENLDAEESLRIQTNGLIESYANQQASDFLTSPVRNLVHTETKVAFATSITKLYKEMAILAYELWSRRPEIKLTTLHDTTPLVFSARNNRFELDYLVRTEEYGDDYDNDYGEVVLNGKPIIAITHPLLQRFGTDKATDYDKGEVWINGLVWFDSGVS